MKKVPLAIMRIEKHRFGKKMQAASSHMVRRRSTPNADPQRDGQWLTEPGDPCELVKKRIESSGVKVRKNAVHAIEILLTASPEYFRPSCPEKAGYWENELVEAWVPCAMGLLDMTFGEDNVVTAVLHLDEATPHISAFVVPIVSTTKGDKLAAKHWCDGRKALSSLQDSYSEAVKGLGIRRGIRGSLAKHMRISQFYSSINAIQKLRLVPVQKPSHLVMNPGEWAESESKRIAREYLKQTQAARQAQEELVIARRKLSEVQATLDLYREYKEIADKVRDIPLQRVAAVLGLTAVPGDPSKFKGESYTLSLTSSKFFDHHTGKGGGGAIDLVKHVGRTSFEGAVGWLADTFSAEAAASASMAHRLERALGEAKASQDSPDRPYLPPARDDGKWPRVREWLVQSRGIPEHVIDHFHKQGFIYADTRSNFCALGPQRCCEIKGTGNEKFARLATGSRPKEFGSFWVRGGKEPRRLVLVESALDVLAYIHLHGPGDYEVVSTAGARHDLPWVANEARSGRAICCAYDADEAGEKAYAALRFAIPTLEREIPRAKDWNDMLLEAKEPSGLNTRQRPRYLMQ